MCKQFKINIDNISRKDLIKLREQIENNLFPFEKLIFLEKETILLNPFQDMQVECNVATVDRSISLLAVIKLNIYGFQNSGINLKVLYQSLSSVFNAKTNGDFLVFLDSENKACFTLKYANNFGFYLFAGRPDLSSIENFSPYLTLCNEDKFIEAVTLFAKIIELLVNIVYDLNNVILENNIEYSFSFNVRKRTNSKSTIKNEAMPGALKRLYSRLGLNNNQSD